MNIINVEVRSQQTSVTSTKRRAMEEIITGLLDEYKQQFPNTEIGDLTAVFSNSAEFNDCFEKTIISMHEYNTIPDDVLVGTIHFDIPIWDEEGYEPVYYVHFVDDELAQYVL